MSEPQLQHLNPRRAYDLLQHNPRALLIDVRSSMEFLFVGHPCGAIHIAWIDEPDWEVNPHFVRQVRELLLGGVVDDSSVGGRAPVILICRSGKRSLEAGRALLAAGIEHVYNVLDGFEGELNAQHQRSTLGGWRFEGLPWEQC